MPGGQDLFIEPITQSSEWCQYKVHTLQPTYDPDWGSVMDVVSIYLNAYILVIAEPFYIQK